MIKFIKKIMSLVLLLKGLNTMAEIPNKLAENISIKILVNKDLQEIKTFITEQSIKLYKNYPYLYEGSWAITFDYFDWLLGLPKTAAAVAYFDSKPIGFALGTSFEDYNEHLQGSIDLFKKNNLTPSSYYYLADIIIVSEYNNDDLYKRLFFELENYAKKLGYKNICLVDETHETHPLKPENYQSDEKIYENNGYQKTSLIIDCEWDTRQSNGKIQKQNHKLLYWIKELN